MAEKIEAWKARDGQVYEDSEAADEADARVEIAELVQTKLLISNADYDEVAAFVWHNRKELWKILNKVGV